MKNDEKENSQKFLLKGDLSGIQPFIFSIPSKGAARTLKVRSFFIQAIMQLCIKKILDGNGSDNLLISDRGGSFYIMMGNEMAGIGGLEKKINNELFELGLYLTLCQTYMDTWELANKRLSEEEEIRKYRKYSLNPSLFDSRDRIKPIDIRIWKDFAGKLSETKAKYEIVESPYQNNKLLTQSTISLFGYTLTLTNRPGALSPTSFNEVPVWRKENIYFRNKDNDPIATWEEDYSEKNNMDIYDTLKENYPIDLNHLGLQAKYRTGTDKISAIALDVDNLGHFFKSKDIENLRNAEDLLKIFFIEKIRDLWEKESFGDTYYYRDNILILFSGGDDCFILGAWDAGLYFLKLLRNEFDKFVKDKKEFEVNNAPLTFSASYLLVDASFPMIQLSDITEEGLFVAKKKDKNAVCLFDQRFSWSDFDKIIELSSTLYDLIVKEGESKALVQKIALSARGYKKLVQGISRQGEVNMERVWNLTWFILRGVKKENKETVNEKIVTEYHDAVLKALSSKDYPSALIFPFSARIAELLIRNKTNKE